MRHIPKLAAVVGTVSIGVLGFQGIASAGTHGAGDYGRDHGKTSYYHPTPKQPVQVSYWWYNPGSRIVPRILAPPSHPRPSISHIRRFSQCSIGSSCTSSGPTEMDMDTDTN